MKRTIPPWFYSEWRDRLTASVLKDGPAPPSEALLQQIWAHQRVFRDKLLLVDGRRLTVLHPGFQNLEPGPDFKKAIIQIGAEPAVEGDIEIDLTSSGWLQHGHAANPAYAGVVLRIVWEKQGKRTSDHPVLLLESVLDSPLEELRWWAGQAGRTPESTPGKCLGPMASFDQPLLEALLWQAACVRLRRKAAALEAIARQHGWRESLLHGLFSALGYKANTWPMRRLAELIPFLPPEDGAVETEARLLGMAGFLARSARSQATPGHPHEKSLWDVWWRDRARLEEHVIPQSAWKLAGTRPANHPERRVALAAAWVSQTDFTSCLEKWLTSTEPGPAALDGLLKVLNPAAAGFWSRHFHLRGKPSEADQPMIGASRATDIAVNILLPWFWCRARAGKNEDLMTRAERLFKEWPASEDNAVLKQARARMLPQASARRLFATAAAQQGLLQITQDFCNHSNALCENCRFPEMLRAAAALQDESING